MMRKIVKKKKLIDMYGIDRYCCRTRILGYCDIVNTII